MTDKEIRNLLARAEHAELLLRRIRMRRPYDEGLEDLLIQIDELLPVREAPSSLTPSGEVVSPENARRTQ